MTQKINITNYDQHNKLAVVTQYRLYGRWMDHRRLTLHPGNSTQLELDESSRFVLETFKE